LIVVGQVAADTYSWCCIVINTVMALVTSNGNMCTGQGIVSAVNCECGRFPTRDDGMALVTVFRNIGSLVVRICSCSIIGLMTSIAVSGKTGKGTIRMAAGAIDGMTLRQWEKSMVHIGGIPCNTVNRMALNAIF